MTAYSFIKESSHGQGCLCALMPVYWVVRAWRFVSELSITSAWEWMDCRFLQCVSNIKCHWKVAGGHCAVWEACCPSECWCCQRHCSFFSMLDDSFLFLWILTHHRALETSHRFVIPCLVKHTDTETLSRWSGQTVCLFSYLNLAES